MTKHGPFIMLPHGIFDGPGYRALHPTDRDVLMLLLRKHNGPQQWRHPARYQRGG